MRVHFYNIGLFSWKNFVNLIGKMMLTFFNLYFFNYQQMKPVFMFIISLFMRVYKSVCTHTYAHLVVPCVRVLVAYYVLWPNFSWHVKLFLCNIMQIFLLICHLPFNFVHWVFWWIQWNLIIVSFVISVMLGEVLSDARQRNFDGRWVHLGREAKGSRQRGRLIKPEANSRILTKAPELCLPLLNFTDEGAEVQGE